MVTKVTLRLRRGSVSKAHRAANGIAIGKRCNAADAAPGQSRLVQGENGPQIEQLDEFIKITYQTAGPLPPPDIHGLMSSSCEITDSPLGDGRCHSGRRLRLLGESGRCAH
ncbi:MAG: hypothetical protein AAGA68_17815 [Pseudomonadota bacterium]